MAQQLSASIYGINGNAYGTASGTIFGFPVQGIIIRPAAEAQTFNGVSCPTVIQVQATGLNQKQDQYYAAASVASLITAANT